MNASRIPRHEQDFFETGIDNDNRRHTRNPLRVRIPGSTEMLDLIECKRVDGVDSFVRKEVFPKKRIVLHFTAGYLKGDVTELTKADRGVSVPFVIARDGRIYNLWASRFWSFHLGPGSKGGNEAMSRTSVGIELSNIGILRRQGNDLHTSTSTAARPDVYCTLDQTELYTRVPAFRGEEFFARFTEAQYVSLGKLLRFLLVRYEIPATFLEPERRFEALDDIASFSGITSHVNYRPDGKWDIGPAFDWERVIREVQPQPIPVAAPVAVAASLMAGVAPAPARAGSHRAGTTTPEDPPGPKTTRAEADERRLPERARTAAERMGRTLDAAPDRVDIRDWFYQPALGALPNRLINCETAPDDILDQGREGACTGFALAAVLNFLLRRRGVRRMVSPRMLYEMARLYDEWPGEAYEGSSARGAMKGWVRHGVCAQKLWRANQHGLKQFYRSLPDGTTVADEARNTPGGAFFRVMHRQVRDMHAALAETGILYCTLMVHEGWLRPGPAVKVYELEGEQVLGLPVITRKGRADGGHAVALVGYTEDGFIVQNSWGPGWGLDGYALLPYEDYLLHATDVWVMQLGVPVRAELWAAGNADSTEGLQRAAPVIPLEQIRPYVVDIGNNGELSTTGDYWNTEADVERLFTKTILERTQGWQKRRILVYLHGGLNSERDVAQRIVAFQRVLLANQIYPVHIMWETGVVETLNYLIDDVFTDADDRAEGDWLRKLRDGLLEAKDRTLELTVARPGRALWEEMKENARLASSHPKKKGGMELIACYATEALRTLSDEERSNLEVHVVAHSAGCIFAAQAIRHLAGLGEAFKSMHFLAPAIRVQDFRRLVYPLIEAGRCPSPILYVLSDAGERDDTVGPYGRSLLYLVSNAFEEKRETPLLGMEKFLGDESVREAMPLLALGDANSPTLIVAGQEYGRDAGGKPRFFSQSNTHGGFDNDPVTLNTVLRHILGRDPDADKRFTVRDLQFLASTRPRR